MDITAWAQWAKIWKAWPSPHASIHGRKEAKEAPTP
ncbi:uncharacterized protein G2W53_015849 [Senna tora]|uniref:Uncharacterized protein n=1 Tax=Senna tora TaxID=362788 RepID=A0A835C651_9FABA|nr:uncharacterized protein G2W53_015849 [Senna tora]